MLLAALAQLTHAAVLVPLTALVGADPLPRRAARRELVVGWLVSVVISLPAAALVFASPVSSQNTLVYTSWIEIETVALAIADLPRTHGPGRAAAQSLPTRRGGMGHRRGRSQPSW